MTQLTARKVCVKVCVKGRPEGRFLPVIPVCNLFTVNNLCFLTFPWHGSDHQLYPEMTVR
jgi:hypothetical protein